jgi:hypothetical protein
MNTSVPQPPTPQQLYDGLRATVDEIGRAWIVVLQRHEYMLEMGRNDALRDALQESYAAHVHNSIQDVFLLDQFRELGALVFDDDSRSPSLRKAFGRLRSPGVLDLLHAEYRKPIGAVIYTDGNADPAITALAREAIERADIERGEREYQKLLSEIPAAEATIFEAPQANRILTARNKGVAHYEIVPDGAGWRTWRIGDTRLTYGELSEFVDHCSAAVEKLMLFVLRRNADMAGFRAVAAGYAANYVKALTNGMQDRVGSK